MTRTTRTVAVVLISLLIAGSAGAAETGGCRLPPEQFLAQMTKVKSWTELHSVYEKNGPACADDGDYAKGYSGAVEDIATTHWSELTELRRLATDDPAFGKFVLHHVDATWPEAQLHAVVRNAEDHCPKGAVRLCSQIAAYANSSLEEPK